MTGTSHQFRPDIQGLRAIAVIGVLVFHTSAAKAPLFEGGFVGVDVFFVISGFLITELMLRDQQSGSSAFNQLAQFYARRARRIIPAAVVVILATLVLTAATQNGLVQIWTARDAVASALFYANVHFVNGADGLAMVRESPLAHYWSLAVEEQFYVVWPLLFLAVCAVAKRRRRLALAITVAVVSLASLVTSVVWLTQPSGGALNFSRAYCLLPSRAWQLGVGALLAIASPRLANAGPALRRVLQWAGLAAIAASFVTFSIWTVYPGIAALLPTLGSAAVVASGIGGSVPGFATWALSSRVAQLGGRYSYSMYLWHLPLYFLVVRPRVPAAYGWPGDVVASLVLTVVAAVVTYHLVEMPVRDARPLRIGMPRQSVLVGAACLAVVVLAGALATDRGESALRIRAGATAAVEAASSAQNVAAAPTDSPAVVPAAVRAELARVKGQSYTRATTPAEAGVAQLTIAVVGDSHAEHLLPGLDRAAASLGARVTRHTLRGCPSFGSPEPRLEQPCTDWKDSVVDEVRRDNPDVIVVSTAGLNDVTKNPAVFSQRVTETVQRFSRVAPVTFVSFTPVANRDTPTCLAANLQSADSCEVVWPVAENAEYQRVSEVNGARFLDLRPVLCAEVRCPAIIGDQIVWADGEHLTATFSASLGPFFTEQLRPALPSGTP